MERVEKIKAAVAATLQLLGLLGILAVDSTLVDAVGAVVMTVGAVALAFVDPAAKAQPQPSGTAPSATGDVTWTTPDV